MAVITIPIPDCDPDSDPDAEGQGLYHTASSMRSKGGVDVRVFHEDRSGLTKNPITICKIRNMNFLAHWHTEVELVYMLRGEMLVGINREARLLAAGDLALIASREIHYYETKTDSAAIMVIFRPEIADSPGGWPPDGDFCTPFVDAQLRRNLSMDAIAGRMRELLREALRERVGGREACDLYIKSRILEICALFLRHLPRLRPDTNEERRRLLQLDRLHKALDYVETHYKQDISPQDAARHINLSVFHFSRLFKEAMGTGFKRYLDAFRVNKAEALLRETRLTVTEIALECGFESIRTFNRVFRAVKGCAPTWCRSASSTVK